MPRNTSPRRAETTAFGCVWLFWAFLILAFWVGVIYVALHFLFKIW